MICLCLLLAEGAAARSQNNDDLGVWKQFKKSVNTTQPLSGLAPPGPPPNAPPAGSTTATGTAGYSASILQASGRPGVGRPPVRRRSKQALVYAKKGLSPYKKIDTCFDVFSKTNSYKMKKKR